MKPNSVLSAYSLVLLMIPASLGRLALPSFYSWMEMNSYICEFSNTNAPVFLAGDEAEQFNCNDLCGDPTETRRACGRLPDDLASNGPPQCHSVPELCVEEFVQQMIGFKLIHNLGGSLDHYSQYYVDHAVYHSPYNNPNNHNASNNHDSYDANSYNDNSYHDHVHDHDHHAEYHNAYDDHNYEENHSNHYNSVYYYAYDDCNDTTAFFAFNPTTTGAATTASPRVPVTPAGIIRVSGEVPAHFAHRSTVQPKAKTENSAANVEQFDAPAELRAPNQLFVVDGNVFESAGSQKSVVVVRKHPEGARTGETQPASFVNHFRGALLTNAHSNCPEDGDFACSFWANLGECKINPRYMLSVCQRSCGVCHP